MTIELSEADFNSQTANRKGLLLFYKMNCPFCKTMEAVIDKFAKAHPDVILFGVDFEGQKALADRFQVERAPTLLVLKDGRVTAQKSGLMNPKELAAFYQQA
ncbi:MAG: thioredoxin family protein [Deltaproteobacteria bacterium]|nr:thioredoxin family protein [Deltaproteobacteria bacterium]